MKRLGSPGRPSPSGLDTGPPERRRRVPFVFVILTALAVAGAGTAAILTGRSRGAERGGQFSSSGPPPLPLARGQVLQIGAPAPDFSFKTLDGRTLRLADVRGQPTVLYFTAYWCTSCIPKAVALGRIYDRLAGRGLRVILVDFDPTSSPALLEGLRKAAGNPRYTFALDEGGRAALAYRIYAVSIGVVIDRGGRVTYEGSFDQSTLERQISKVL